MRPRSPADVSPDELVARYGGDVVRYREREEVPPARWERGRAADGRGWGVGALVESDGRVLLVREEGQWFLPGGMLEPGESHAEGAARELEEETGVVAEVTDLLAVTERTVVNAVDGRAFEFGFATFRARPGATAVSGDPGLPDEDIDRAAWHGTLPPDTFDDELVARLRDRDL